MEKHSALPRSITPEALAAWLQENFIDSYIHEVKTYFTEEEIDDMRKTLASKNIELVKLEQLKKEIADSIKKGSDGYSVDVPETIGIDSLRKGIEHLSMELNRGYLAEDVKVFGIPDVEEERIEFFDISGIHYPERGREMTKREINQYIGLFNRENRIANES